MCIDNLYSFIEKVYSNKLLIIFTLLFFTAGFLNINKPLGIAQVVDDTGGVGVLDEADYTAEEAYHILESMGEKGRESYKRLLLTIEMIFPFCYRMFSVLFLFFLASHIFHKKSNWKKLCLLPFIGMFLDYLENAMVLIMLFKFPNSIEIAATIASLATSLKWLSNYLDWTLMILGIIVVLFLFMKQKISK
jgi:hypothetical protein